MSIDNYPVECPKCDNGTLDTGGECNTCDYDVRNGKQNFVDGFRKLAKEGNKEKIAEFLRKNSYGNAYHTTRGVNENDR